MIAVGLEHGPCLTCCMENYTKNEFPRLEVVKRTVSSLAGRGCC